MPLGALHVHSTWSDGEFTLPELRQVLGEAGCTFACVTDHADFFDEQSLHAYVAECESLSDERFRFIAGLEYPCEQRLHIIGYGATALTTSADPSGVMTHIEAVGGVSVIAHPPDALFDWIASLDRVPQGLEVWNSKYDGRYAPRAATFALYARLRTRRSDCHAFYGQDLHWRRQYRGLFTEVDCASTRRADVLAALAVGAFVGRKDALRLPSDGTVSHDWLVRAQHGRQVSVRFRQILKRAKALADRSGVPVPAAVKAQLRRMF
jgi:hypothetical protein